MTMRRSAAFTLVEILVATCLSSVVGLIVYGVASEGLTSFARNVSINRSYSNARQSIDRISIAMQSAGHTPILVTNTGTDVPSGTATTAAGIRFWRYNSTPLYYINTPRPDGHDSDRKPLQPESPELESALPKSCPRQAWGT